MKKQEAKKKNTLQTTPESGRKSSATICIKIHYAMEYFSLEHTRTHTYNVQWLYVCVYLSVWWPVSAYKWQFSIMTFGGKKNSKAKKKKKVSRKAVERSVKVLRIKNARQWKFVAEALR